MEGRPCIRFRLGYDQRRLCSRARPFHVVTSAMTECASSTFRHHVRGSPHEHEHHEILGGLQQMRRFECYFGSSQHMLTGAETDL